MSTQISGQDYKLTDIFCDKFRFFIPAYQRPYSWTEEESSILVEDLINFYKTEPDESYFLGSIVLIKKDDPYSEVIDGQQRLTTLTILFSAIASLFKDPVRKYKIEQKIKAEDNEFDRIEAEPRLHLRKLDQDFFNKTIQEVNLELINSKTIDSLPNEAQQNIIKNFLIIREKLDKEFKTEDELVKFASFLMNDCYLVVVSTPTQQSAFRIFSILNSRGLDLLPIDIIKSNVIGKIPTNQQQEYTDKWEDLEIQTSRAGFNDLFTHIRMIYAKERPRKSLLEEFNEIVIPKFSPKEFINDILEPYTEIYTILINSDYKGEYAEKINHYLNWLNRIDNSDWIPVALNFFKNNQNNPETLLEFIKKLERLASYLHITSKDVNKRVKRYGRILSEIEDNEINNLDNPLESLELNNDEKEEFLSVLNGEIFRLTPVRRNYIILRLDSLVSDQAFEYRMGKNILTIEHVLPQTVKANSYWDINWPDIDIRESWLNRIANLVPLTRRKNSRAQNYDFDIKKEKYFKGPGGTTSYPLTVQVLNEEEWTPEVLEKRQDYLLNFFINEWDLNITEEIPDKKTFYLNSSSSNAKGFLIKDNKIKVLKGSIISNKSNENLKKYYPKAYKLRKELEQLGIIQNNIFQEDHIFDNPSQAAAVILGRNCNGYSEWKDVYDKKLENYISH